MPQFVIELLALLILPIKRLQLISLSHEVAVDLAAIAALLGNATYTVNYVAFKRQSMNWKHVGNMNTIGQRCCITSVSSEQGGRWLHERHGSDYQHISAWQILRKWLLTNLRYISLDAMNER